MLREFSGVTRVTLPRVRARGQPWGERDHCRRIGACCRRQGLITPYPRRLLVVSVGQRFEVTTTLQAPW